MRIRDERIKRLFAADTGKAVMIPMDHGIMLGAVDGLIDPLGSLKAFVGLGADALLINFGILKLAFNYLENLEKKPGIIVGVDFNENWLGWKKPIESDVFVGHTLTTKVEYAAKYNADCVKVLFPLGLEPGLNLEYIRHTCEVINEAEKYDMPVMIEPTTHGQYISESKKNDPKVIADGCRIALELGADVLKIPYPGHEFADEFRDICDNSHVPVIMLGGPKAGGIRNVLEIARFGIDAGSKGTIFGRNIWGRPDMQTVVKALQDIVHGGATVDEAVNKHGIQ